jgi:hypothetical protein
MDLFIWLKSRIWKTNKRAAKGTQNSFDNPKRNQVSMKIKINVLIKNLKSEFLIEQKE